MQTVTRLDQKRREMDAKVRTERYGPVPVNPFRSLREAADLSLGELAAYTGVDRRALQRLEFGMYNDPLPSAMTYWVTKRAQITEGELLNAYADYKDRQRSRHLFYFGADLATDPFAPDHPFRQLRARRPSLVNDSALPVGLTEVGQALCLPLDSLQFFEKKYRLQQSVPKQLLNVLNQIGYSRDEITQFEKDYGIWRNQRKVTFHE